MRSVDALIIGGGQAGLATSFLLTRGGIDHLVLERDSIAARWRSRWDSFTLVTPNWMTRLPGGEYGGPEPDGFMPRDEVVAHLERYADSFGAPLRLGTDARAVVRHNGGYRVETNTGLIDARAVVVASGSFQRPRRPSLGSLPAGVLDLHSNDYRNPEQLPAGAVLVVGSGQSGAQLAEELHEAGRRVFLSVSRAPRLPRRYRGRDITRWLADMGAIGKPADELEDPRERFAANAHASGKRGGHTINLHRFARDGISLLGKVHAVSDGIVTLAGDLDENLARADKTADQIRRAVDAYVAERGIDAPPPDEHNSDDYDGDDGFRQPPRGEIDLAGEGVSTVIWSAGYAWDFSWVSPAELDEFGYPVQRRGVTKQPGLYFLGLNYLYLPTSGLLYGVGDDARHVAEHIDGYLGRREQNAPRQS